MEELLASLERLKEQAQQNAVVTKVTAHRRDSLAQLAIANEA